MTVHGTVFTFTEKLLAGLPEARGFLEDLMARGRVSPSVATTYVKLVAKLKRQGRLGAPEHLIHPVERTAANAYHRWAAEGYQLRVQPVVRAFKHDDVRRGVSWLRRGSLVPPYAGKVVPRVTSLSQITLDPETLSASATSPTIGWFPCDKWTLHVPVSEDVPAHADPCVACTPIELDDVLLEAVACAFEKAWGHRDLAIVPMDALLFGQPPREWESTTGAVAPAQATGRVVALVSSGTVASAITGMGGSATADLDSFVARLNEGVDVLVLAKDVLGKERFDDIALNVDSVVREAMWARDNPEAVQATADARSEEMHGLVSEVPA
jgi:hypothetical protein